MRGWVGGVRGAGCVCVWGGGKGFRLCFLRRKVMGPTFPPGPCQSMTSGSKVGHAKGRGLREKNVPGRKKKKEIYETREVGWWRPEEG